MTKAKKQVVQDPMVDELTADLQRMRADFENYRKRSEQEKSQARQSGQSAAIVKLLPVIDTIERAIAHVPQDIAEHTWVQGIGGLVKQFDKTLAGLELKRIDASKGTVFNPTLHEAVQFNEEATGESEVIEEELQAGYTLQGDVLRPSMVKVTRK